MPDWCEPIGLFVNFFGGLMSVILPIHSPYAAKDQRKANAANKFIGRGSAPSSTHAYVAAYGSNANCGVYTSDDIVFISAEGARSGRLDPDFNEIGRACAANARFITDNATHRARPYNVGERQVSEFLTSQGYRESRPGVWSRPKAVDTSAAVQPNTILGYQFINSNGVPVGNVQPTTKDVEEVARFEEAGRFYSIVQTEHGQTFLRYHYSKGMA